MAASSRLILALLIVTVLAGCRFKSATVAEQQALVSRGGFSGGAPAWSPRTVTGSAAGIPLRDSGGIPERFNSPAVSYAANSDNDQFFKQVQNSRAKLIDEKESGEEEGIVVNRDKESSPLDRIAKVCPGIDAEAEEAILIENSAVRVQKYQELTRRCPLSADLWTWLSRDQLSSGNFAEAESAARQALAVQPEFSPAQTILDKITGQDAGQIQ